MSDAPDWDKVAAKLADRHHLHKCECDTSACGSHDHAADIANALKAAYKRGHQTGWIAGYDEGLTDMRDK